MGIGKVFTVGLDETTGLTQYRVDGWLKEDRDKQVVVFLDLPTGGDAFAVVGASHGETAFFNSSQNTSAAVPPELKGKLLTREQADALDPPPKARPRRRRSPARSHAGKGAAQ